MKLFAIILLVPILSCAANVVGAGGLSPRQLQAAQKLYTAKCAKCHKFYDPNAYSQAEWDLWMGKMRKKSKLRETQFDLLSRYTQTLRTQQKTE
jgi:hypothetical protein